MATWKAQRPPRKQPGKKYYWGLGRGRHSHQRLISHPEGIDGDLQVASHSTGGLILLTEA